MKQFFLLLICFSAQFTFAQSSQTYKNKKEQTHLCGAFSLEELANIPDTEWYQQNYDSFKPQIKKSNLKKKLKNTKVTIYLGTWCGDSKTWVPRFVKLWDELGLDRKQLTFIGLYDDDERYKQGPNGEEKGKMIHRVPTFIFEQKGQEVARIVESPSTSLETDIAQIALGIPPTPNYKAANYMMDLLASKSKEELTTNFKTYVNKAYRLTSKSNELNTLGYVYLRAGEIEKALTVFQYNTYFFKYNPNVYDSYAEALTIAGEKEMALAYYKKVVAIDAENKHAQEQIKELEESLVGKG